MHCSRQAQRIQPFELSLAWHLFANIDDMHAFQQAWITCQSMGNSFLKENEFGCMETQLLFMGAKQYMMTLSIGYTIQLNNGYIA